MAGRRQILFIIDRYVGAYVFVVAVLANLYAAVLCFKYSFSLTLADILCVLPSRTQ